MAARKYHKKNSIILTILLFAVITVIAVIAYIYTYGVRYIKNIENEKFFGFVSKDGSIDNGHVWTEKGITIKISREKFYTVVRNDSGESDTQANDAVDGKILYENFAEDGLTVFVDNIPSETELLNCVFNTESYDYFLLSDTVYDYITQNEKDGNVVEDAYIRTADGTEWTLSANKGKSDSYKSYDVIKTGGSGYRYKGDLFAFLKNEDVVRASITLKDAKKLILAKTFNTYRMVYNLSGGKKDIYIGEIDDMFRKNGVGTYYSDNGEIYCGEFLLNERIGECMFRTMFGDIYKGQFINGVRTGEGTCQWKDGMIYTGGFVNDMKHGYGETYYPNGEYYKGEYDSDRKHGTGTYKWENGDTYTGDYEYDIRTGKGIYTWASGEIYNGEFKNDQMHGEGTYYWPSGRQSYEGFFENNEMVTEKPEE